MQQISGCKLGAKMHPVAPTFVEFCSPKRSATLLECMAGTTGLEPATSAVTEVHSEVTH